MRILDLLYPTLLITLVLIASSCNKEESNPDFEDSPVVEAYLYSGKSFELKISRQIAFSEDAVNSSDDIDLLEIQVHDSLTSYMLNPIGDGVYRYDDLLVDENSEYELSFVYNGLPVSAYTIIPTKPEGFEMSDTELTIETPSSGGTPGFMADPLQLEWNNPDQSYYIVLVENIEDNPEAIREHDEGEEPPRWFRNEPTLEDNYEINTRTFTYYGTHRVVLYHVNPDYALLYDDDGSTSQNLTEPSTGITNGYGVFTGLNSDTLWVEVVD